MNSISNALDVEGPKTRWQELQRTQPRRRRERFEEIETPKNATFFSSFRGTFFSRQNEKMKKCFFKKKIYFFYVSKK